MDADLKEEALLVHQAIDWTDVLRAAEKLGANHNETIGCRSADLFHIAAAMQLGCGQFLTFDTKQTARAKAVGLAVKPQSAVDGTGRKGRWRLCPSCRMFRPLRNRPTQETAIFAYARSAPGPTTNTTPQGLLTTITRRGSALSGGFGGAERGHYGIRPGAVQPQPLQAPECFQPRPAAAAVGSPSQVSTEAVDPENGICPLNTLNNAKRGSRCNRTGLHPEGEAGVIIRSARLASVSLVGGGELLFPG